MLVAACSPALPAAFLDLLLIGAITMKQLKTLYAAIAAIGCLGSSAALAQSSYNPSWYLLPSVNAIDPENHFGVEKRGEGVGIRLGKPIAPNWDIQFGPTFSRARENGIRYQQNTLGVDALFLFSRDRLRPFLLVGVGAEQDRVNARNFAWDKTSPYVNGGAGVQYSVTDRLFLQADVRRVYGYTRHSNDFGSGRVNNNYVTLGVGYVFDTPPAPQRVVERAPPPPAPAPVPVPPPVITPPPPPVIAAPPPPPPRIERTTLSAEELFEFNRSDLRMPQPKLDEMAAVLSANPQISNVNISGYTDRIGSDAYNLKLSQRRANAVKAYLVNKGISANRLNAIGKGKSNPVVQCAQKSRPALIRCLEPNRRVVVEQITVERRVP